ncbi:MAG: hypothetical protein H7Y04_16915 [Verrucomicrobia bacterium]|nr:hypothetical protein [Cytophagales bacterium]
MDNSIEGVTLYAAFVNDILKNYEEKKDQYQGLFAMAASYDLNDPFRKVPMQLYNDMCAWIEKELGKFNLIRVGRNVGETAFGGMVANGLLKEISSPIQIMEALVTVANTMIQDPKKRGWEIVKSTKDSITMRRTQTFNRQLQLGLLDGLVRKSGVKGVKVDFMKNVETGDAFDEYLITWV